MSHAYAHMSSYVHTHRKVAEAELEVSKADCKVAKAELAALKAKDTPASQLAEAER